MPSRRLLAFAIAIACLITGLLLFAPMVAPHGAVLAVVTYAAAVKTKRMQSVIDKVDGKTYAASTGSAVAGSLVIGTSALSGATGVLATIPLPTPSFVESGGVITLQGVPLTAAATAAGTAAKAELRDNGGTTIVSGLTVGTSGTDIIVGTTTVSVGLDVEVISGTLTHA